MKARGFWTPGVTAFFDVRITHVNSRSNQGKHTATIFKEQENEKKRKYNQSHRCRDGNSYTIGVWYKRTGGMGLDSQNFLRTLANKFSSKNKELYAGVISWRRANARNVSFSISVRWSIYIINSVDKPNFRVSLPHRRSTTVSLETNPPYYPGLGFPSSDVI